MNDENNKVTIRTASVKNDDGSTSPYLWTVHQRGLQLGFFKADEYDRPELAAAEAQALADKLKAIPWVSPFVTHAGEIMADYGTAAKLRRIVLSLYNGYSFPVDLSDISGMDNHHFQIVVDLMRCYHTLGENDKEMLKLAERIKKEFGCKPVKYASESEEAE
jgi:hypothetical protein